LPIAVATSNQQNSAQSPFWDPDSSVSTTTTETIRRVLVGQTVADVERHLILNTLDYCFGNRTHAAKILGISIRTLRNKLNEYTEAGILVPESGQKHSAASAAL
jgi:DNA-binding NtrC family response regulator